MCQNGSDDDASAKKKTWGKFFVFLEKSGTENDPVNRFEVVSEVDRKHGKALQKFHVLRIGIHGATERKNQEPHQIPRTRNEIDTLAVTEIEGRYRKR